EKRRVAVRAAGGRGVREASPFVAEHGGVNVHAGVMVHGRGRAGLERLCRYVTRPPIALERLTEHADGCVEYAFRKPWRDGTRAVVLTEEDFMARICAMVPPPRFHLTRYAGVLAPNAKLRAEVVPGRRRDEELAAVDERRDGGAGVQGELFGGGSAANDEEKDREARSSRHPWAWLLKRVFAAEVLVCVHCAGRLRVVEIATEPEATRRIARAERGRRGEPERSVEARASPRGPPGQLSFTFR
ncbi:MAG: transposase, partial [Gemmatimonadota bacterium]